MNPTRRDFLTYLGLGTYSLLRSCPLVAAPFPLKNRSKAKPSFFSPIAPSGLDTLVLPKGFKSQILASRGDQLSVKGPFGNETFGDDNDFLAFFPLDALTTNRNTEEGLLWVNHEAMNPLLVSGYSAQTKRTVEQIQIEKLAVGGSILHVRREKGIWKRVPDSSFTKRITSLYPDFAVTGPVSESIPVAKGTLGNCSGGKTLWNTVLSCEENYDNFNQDYGWGKFKETTIDENQYGWVVEVDPFGELPPQKHSALGRFMHENAAMTVGKSGKLVVYMGDDTEDQFFYKFVSKERYVASQSRAEKRKLLTEGTLYAADFEKGRWIALDIERNQDLKAAGFSSQAQVLLECRRAAKAAKATPVDRPEDCEVHPKDGSIYIAFTNNKNHGNLYGQIVRLVESKDDSEAETFRYEIFLAGGPQSGLSCPDNLCFDKNANLWVACDISAKYIGSGAYEIFGNNGLFYVPTSGNLSGNAYQFASAPKEAELTGPWFTEKGDTLFLSVQHPGEKSSSLSSLNSHWPMGGTEPPKSSVVAITGFSY